MSKLYERYLELKKQDSSILYLFKSGIFYIFLDEDAKKMSYILNLKLSNLNESILKCGIEDSRIRSVVAITATINERIRRYSLIPIFKGLQPIKTECVNFFV